ncbi:hypothetical protein YC2023_032490 [Brassica napus]
MFSDQQLMASEETETWVRAYASDPLLFQRDFIKSMVKLSSYHVLTGPLGNGELHLPKSDTPTNASARTLPITNFVYDQRPPTAMKVKTQAILILTLFTSLGLNFLRLK